jgi:tetraacyldisaccharide 4'-kinase
MKITPRILLFPFSIGYFLAVTIRNFLFNKGILKSRTYKIPVISVGNITVGGTGKTPLTEFLIRLLSPYYHCALLSRGYGRKTKGPMLAGKNASPESIGDEPMQMKLKYPDLTVAVAEKRVSGMEKLLNLPSPPQVVLMDDAYQHRAIYPSLSILITDYYRPIYNDLCLPAGNLREPVSGKKRAQIIVINKCPIDFSEKERDLILKKLAPLPYQLVYFSSISYHFPRKLISSTTRENIKIKDHKINKPILAIAGIGNPVPFFEEVSKYSGKVETITYRDHHDFTEKDFNKILVQWKKMGPEAIVLTTEKDAVKLMNKNIAPELSEKIWYIPIELKILFNQQGTFIKTIENYVRSN